MPTIDKLVQGAKQLKVKEVPGYVSKFAAEHYTPDQTKSRLANWLNKYKVQVSLFSSDIICMNKFKGANDAGLSPAHFSLD
jgi:hypothetical protein